MVQCKYFFWHQTRTIFSKKEFQIWDFESFILWSKFTFFGGLLYGILASIFRRRLTIMVVDIFTQPLCIPLRGNISLCGNAVCILFISSERVGFFWLNFAALIQVSIETFWDPYIENLNYLRMRTLQLLITTHYLQFSWHDMNFKLLLV